jgi:hypothetical protein
MKTTESVLREYIQFEDVNQSKTIELLPLTIIDAMDEYANQQKRGYSDEDIINALHSVELKDNKDYSKIYKGMKEWFEQFKKK